MGLIDLTIRKDGLEHVTEEPPDRWIFRTRGYRATIVSGAVTYCDGEATGVLPGKLVRGAQKT